MDGGDGGGVGREDVEERIRAYGGEKRIGGKGKGGRRGKREGEGDRGGGEAKGRNG